MEFNYSKTLHMGSAKEKQHHVAPPQNPIRWAAGPPPVQDRWEKSEMYEASLLSNLASTAATDPSWKQAVDSAATISPNTTFMQSLLDTSKVPPKSMPTYTRDDSPPPPPPPPMSLLPPLPMCAPMRSALPVSFSFQSAKGADSLPSLRQHNSSPPMHATGSHSLPDTTDLMMLGRAARGRSGSTQGLSSPSVMERIAEQLAQAQQANLLGGQQPVEMFRGHSSPVLPRTRFPFTFHAEHAPPSPAPAPPPARAHHSISSVSSVGPATDKVSLHRDVRMRNTTSHFSIPSMQSPHLSARGGTTHESMMARPPIPSVLPPGTQARTSTPSDRPILPRSMPQGSPAPAPGASTSHDTPPARNTSRSPPPPPPAGGPAEAEKVRALHERSETFERVIMNILGELQAMKDKPPSMAGSSERAPPSPDAQSVVKGLKGMPERNRQLGIAVFSMKTGFLTECNEAFAAQVRHPVTALTTEFPLTRLLPGGRLPLEHSQRADLLEGSLRVVSLPMALQLGDGTEAHFRTTWQSVPSIHSDEKLLLLNVVGCEPKDAALPALKRRLSDEAAAERHLANKRVRMQAEEHGRERVEVMDV